LTLFFEYLIATESVQVSAVEHVLGMLVAGDKTEDILAAYPWLEAEDIRACLAYAHRLVSHERCEPAITE